VSVLRATVEGRKSFVSGTSVAWKVGTTLWGSGMAEWFVLGLVVVLILMGSAATSNAEKALNDPNEKSRVFLDELPALALLAGAGTFRVLIIRQSGNLHAQYEATSASAAISKAMATFRRAKIDAIRVSRNSPNELHFNRLFHSHRGSAEGKKVGGVEITRIA